MAERVKADNEKFCYECGEAILTKAEICPKCGVRQPFIAPAGVNYIKNIVGQGEPRSKIMAGLLALLLGGVGAHKFYMGKPIWGIVYLLLIWTFIPAIFGFIEGINFFTMSDEVFSKRHGGPAWRSN
jgi:hypothetical protein